MIDYKYNELALLQELRQYIDGTYNEHYSQSKVQTTEFIIDNGDGSFISMHKSAYDEMIAKQEELGSE